MTNLLRRRIRASLLACCLLMLCATAHAEFTLKDVQIAGRALGFLEKPLSGDVKAGIVYAPADPQSVHEAEALQALLGEGLRVGNVRLVPVLVPVTEVGHAKVALFFLIAGITAADTKVRAGVCAMGVRSQPKVEILVNRAAAASTSLAFSAVFRMMITET